ncbi:MAG TPA: protein kinase, partial [Bacteroidota bacterium]|nr:protein kinase [Bacteroidota bacterium]
LDTATILDYAVQIAEGLSRAHAKQIVHRDIKSDNIMVTEDGLVKIMDFGLAKLRGVSTLTKEGSTLGTLGYISPEQLHGTDPDQRTDIYAFGVLLYEMVAGRLPFQGSHEAALMYEITNSTPLRLTAQRPEVDPRFEQMVFRCLEKDREKRYQSIQEVVAVLREIRGSASVSQVMPGGARAATRRRMPRRKILYAAILGLIIVAIVGLVIFLPRHGEAIDSIAVLPFENQNHDPDAEYLSDGIAEQIMNSLSQIPTVRVIPRSTVFAYKAKNLSAQAVGEELKVKSVLTGRVLLRKNNLIVQTELIDVNRQAQLWGEQYTRTITDLLGLQEDIAKQISSNLRLRLSGEQERRLAKRYTENADAYQLYLKGNFFVLKASPDGLAKGLDLFNQALALDSNFALPYLGRAYYYAIATDFYLAPREAMPLLKENATRALAIDDELSDAHTWLAWYYLWYEYDWAKSEKEFLRAIELSPGSRSAHEYYSWLLCAQGRSEESIREAGKAAELDPLSAEATSMDGLMLYYAHRYEEALAKIQKSSELDPDYPLFTLVQGLCLTQQGRFAEGIAALRRSHAVFAAPWTYARVAYAEAKTGHTSRARAMLDTLRVQSTSAYVASDIVASVYVALGDTEEALHFLDKAYQERTGWLIWLKIDPIWDPIRADPRFQALLKTMNLH